MHPVSTRGNRCGKRLAKRARELTFLLASDSGSDGETPPHNFYFFLDLHQKVAGGGSFAKEHCKDDHLKHKLAQVYMIEGKETQPRSHPLPDFIIRYRGEGVGKDPAGGAIDKDGDRAGFSTLAPACWPPWSSQHHPTGM